jgi:sulfatase modifying factor 1
VGSYADRASLFGAHTLAGNVWEWVSDWYSSSYYRITPYINPAGPSSGISKVMSGGGWVFYPVLLRSAFRNPSYPDTRGNVIGFSCATTP